MPRLNLTYENVVGFFKGKHPEARKAYIDFLTKEVKDMNAAEAAGGAAPTKRKPGPKAVVDPVKQDEALERKLNKKKPGPKKGAKKKKDQETVGGPAAAPAGEAAPATGTVAPPVVAGE